MATKKKDTAKEVQTPEVDQLPAQENATQKSVAKKTTSKPNVLETIGRRVMNAHDFEKVWVTSDGQVFPIECDARNHALNLEDKNIISVTK